MQAVLEVLWRFSRMPRGNCPVGLAAITFWSGCSRSTVYRYCKGLAALGMVEYVEFPDGHKNITGWRISGDGVAWMERG
jgi:DNA-binding IclR family transcriptional regulator